jgi:hypothetical protein
MQYCTLSTTPYFVGLLMLRCAVQLTIDILGPTSASTLQAKVDANQSATHTHAQARQRHLRRSSEYQIVNEMLEVDLPAHLFFLISFILVILVVVVVVVFIMIVFVLVVKDSKRDQYTCEPPLIETVLPSRTMVDSVRVITRPRLSV